MNNVTMHGMSRSANWNLDTAEGMANAVEWQRRQFALLRDQGRWIVPRSGSVIVVDQVNKQAILVTALLPEDGSIKRVVEAMGWKWVDRTELP